MNLWADFDDNLRAAAESQEHVVPARRLTEQAMLSTLRAWLLADYAAPYCRSLGTTRIFRRCYWVDGLGLNARTRSSPTKTQTQPMSEHEQNGQSAENGSAKGRKKNNIQETPAALQPILALSQALAQAVNPITVYALLLAAGSSRRKTPHKPSTDSELSRSTPLFDGSRILPYSWLEIATQALAELSQSPTIFLLNPLGPTLYGNDDLAPLYQRTVPTELLLLIPHRQIETHLRSAQRLPEQGATLTTLLRSDRWKTLALKPESLAESISSFNTLLLGSMQRHFSLPVQLLALPMLLRPGFIYQMPYTLLFATRRQDSLFCMNDAVCLYQRRLYEQSYRGLLTEEWFAAQQRERFHAAYQQAEQRILTVGRAQRMRRWPELRQQLLLASFGILTTQDYDQIIRQLLEKRIVRCEWRRVSSNEGEERVPGNEDALLWS